MKTDSLFYRIFLIWPELVFKLANIQTSASNYTFTSEEVKQTASRIDGILKPPETEKNAPFIVLEVQMQKDDQLYSRIFKELFTYLDIHKPEQPWQVVVIYPSKTQESDHRRDHYKHLLDSPDVHIIYLKDLLKKLPDVPGLGFLKLVMATPSKIQQQVEFMLQESEEKSHYYGIEHKDYLELIETIIVYKYPKMSWEEIHTMLDLHNIDLKDTRVYQDAMKEGRQEGRQEEREQARLRELALVQRLLTRQIGVYNKTFDHIISKLSVDKLDVLVEALLDFSSVDDLQSWLIVHTMNESLTD